jgi:dihydroorotase-like cyclic amidohydrolase
MSYDLIIANGTVATASDTFARDVGIRDGRIVALGLGLGDANRVIDATGRPVLPGGIDSHVHIAQPSGEGIVADDFESGTRSAAFGGNTTVLPFCVKGKGTSLRETVIAIGVDADTAIWDPEREVTISPSLLHHGGDYTPYEGFAVEGWPVTTIVRGQVVVHGGELKGAPGTGAYVRRALSAFARPARDAA